MTLIWIESPKILIYISDIWIDPRGWIYSSVFFLLYFFFRKNVFFLGGAKKNIFQPNFVVYKYFFIVSKVSEASHRVLHDSFGITKKYL